MGENGRKNRVREGEPFPRWLTRQYQGQYIVFSHQTQEVIGVGETEGDAFAQAETSGVAGPWHVAYSDMDGVEYIF
jgi:hypothetical protein